jgi:hypothetical protein
MFAGVRFAITMAFNQDISSWDVSSGTTFVSTECSFGFQFKKQNICGLFEYFNKKLIVSLFEPDWNVL